MKKYLVFLVAASQLLAVDPGVNALLETLEGKAPTKVKEAEREALDPFLSQLYATTNSRGDLSFDVRMWVNRVLSKDFEGAAHQWSTIHPKLSTEMENTGRAAYLYSLWHLNTPQTFLNEWLSALAKESFKKNPLAAALEAKLAPEFDSWVVNNVPTLEPEAITTINRFPATRGGPFLTLHAWKSLRSPKDAKTLLAQLPADHKLKRYLGETVVLDLVRNGKLVEAGKVLRESVEPTFVGEKDLQKYAQHQIQMARILYQAGALDDAERFYEKVPNGARSFLDARDELAWTWLRLGKTEKVRGLLKTMTSSLFDDRFSPETFVVLAISNLKFCHYNKTSETLKAFIDVHQKWAKKVSEALDAGDPPSPEHMDSYAEFAAKAVELRTEELKKMEEISARSIKAALPAVGIQSHWLAATKALQTNLETVKKKRAAEYRREWTNQQRTLQEAIRKMRYVKVELLTQVQQLAQVEKFAQPKTAENTLNTGNAQVYPFDGVVWPDELFSLQSTAETQCLRKGKL